MNDSVSVPQPFIGGGGGGREDPEWKGRVGGESRGAAGSGSLENSHAIPRISKICISFIGGVHVMELDNYDEDVMTMKT